MSIQIRSDNPTIRRVFFPVCIADESDEKLVRRKDGTPRENVRPQSIRDFLSQKVDTPFGMLTEPIQACIGLCVPDDAQWAHVAIQIFENHDTFVDALLWRRDDRPVALRFGIGAIERAAQGSQLGAALLVGLGTRFCVSILDGAAEREALIGCLESASQWTSDEQKQVEQALSVPGIDPNGVFLRFFQEGLNADLDERQRLAAWVLSRAQVQLPYDAPRVRHALDSITDIAQLRFQTYSILNETFDYELDGQNADRVAQWCREEGVRLIGGRFSRAFYLEAMLAASAKVFDPQVLEPCIGELNRHVSQSRLNFLTKDLSRHATAIQTLGGEKQALLNLLGEHEVSVAQVDGAINNFLEALRSIEQQIQETIDGLQRVLRDEILQERKENDGASPTWRRFQADREEVVEQCDRLRVQVMRIEEAVAAAAKRDPAFIVFFQRLFPLDAINIGTVNEFVDPFFGEDEHVRRLISDCGHRMYITPNLSAWLRHCEDWIEALPAYASYTITPRGGGGYDIRPYVQRGILEDMFRRHAEDWALNIEEVVRLENAALARELLAESKGLLQSAIEISEREREPIEEVIRRLPEMAENRDRLAGLAVLVEVTANELAVELARWMEHERSTRYEALRSLLRNSTDDANLVAPILHAPDRDEAVVSTLKSCGVSDRADVYREIALARRRNLPNLHVLTTLGPGETNTHIRNWLEESMGLFNVTRAYSLEEKAQERVSEYESRIIAAAKRIVAELDLQGDLFAIMEEEGLDPEDSSNRKEALLKLVFSYPEVGLEVSRLAVIAEMKGELEDLKQEALLPSIAEFREGHPELERDAIQRVIAENEIEAKNATDLIEQNPDWQREKESYIFAQARSELVRELGLEDETQSYLKRRVRNMHGILHARREVITEANLCAELDNPQYRYEATGPFKRYNILYTPSRVDLGAQEVHSVRNVPKWVGGIDIDAANSGRSFYSLYNMAGVTAVNSPKIAEFLKVGENFFSRGGVFYLSLTAGVNIDMLGIGDFEFCRGQWNMRGDRVVLPTGETYGGFCVPKEFSLLYSIIVAALRPATSEEVFNSFGIPKEMRGELINDLRAALRIWPECGSLLEWEEKARDLLSKRLKGTAGRFAARLPRLALTLEELGVLSREELEEKHKEFAFTDWVNKKAQGLEEINRAGPFRKVHLIQRLVHEARKKNSDIADDSDLVLVLGASYKEGERIAGKEIPITDVRFSAGARKLAIYAGMAEEHLLLDLDPDGRELTKSLLEGLSSPGDVRLVGRCTGSDILAYVPGSGLEEAKEEILAILQENGLDDNTIDANAEVYGGSLENWAGVKDLPETQKKQLIDRIGGRIHLVVTDRRGPLRTYREAVQGSDCVDLGIPDPELLDLIDDLPRLTALMRRGRENSALVFADGTSGGRRRAFSYRYTSSERKVKELAALEPNAVYGSLGLGMETIQGWRAEMEDDRRRAVMLREALRQRDPLAATSIYENIRKESIKQRRAERAASDEVNAREVQCSPEILRSYHFVSEACNLVKRGLCLGNLDFGTWLILGGMYELNGRHSTAEIDALRREFESLIDSIPKEENGLPGLPPEAVDEVISAFVRPRYVVPIESEYREVSTGIEGSLKAAEEQVSRLAQRAARRKQARYAHRQRVQRRAFLTESPEGGIEELYRTAAGFLGDGSKPVEPKNYGSFLAWAQAYVRRAAGDLEPSNGQLSSQIDLFFETGAISEDAYLSVSESLAKAAEAYRAEKDKLETCAKALELIDRALLIERTIGVVDEDPDELMVQIARYFDTTVNGHVFDYIPYHYHKQRSAAFESLSREEKIELASRRHDWLYRYARMLMVGYTRLVDTDEAYRDEWIGDATKNRVPIGVRGDDPAERFWFSYARLRDASVLVHEGYPLPELFVDVPPEAIEAGDRPTVAIVYPFGNTTVPVALEQGPRLAEVENINLILSAFPTLERNETIDRSVLRIHDGLIFLQRSDFARLLQFAGRSQEEIERRSAAVGDGGVFAAVRFSHALDADAVFFHFTHPLRADVGHVGCPLIQPILWEAATHLKCRLPEMLEGSGVRTADQFNWYHSELEASTSDEAKEEIKGRLVEFAEKHDTAIVKPEKESGGRRAKILPIRKDGAAIRENIEELTDLIYDISKTDNAVIQSVIPSRVRQLFTRGFLEHMVDRFARIGVPCHLDREPQTPLFCYFRQIVVRGAEEYEITHHITVVSTAGIANVGQGGLLYEYTDEMIHPKYRDDLREEITWAVFHSIHSQRKYIKENQREILDEYLGAYPEFKDKVPQELGADLTGVEDSDIPYEMGDYMPYMLVDENDNYTALYDRKNEEILPLYHPDGSITDTKIFDKDGKELVRLDPLGQPASFPAFDASGNRIEYFNEHGEPVRTLAALKIEPNPGAGLWRPHNDQLPLERKGEGVYKIFRCLGERGRLYRQRFLEMGGKIPATEKKSRETIFIPSSATTDLVNIALRRAEEEIQ